MQDEYTFITCCIHLLHTVWLKFHLTSAVVGLEMVTPLCAGESAIDFL